MKKEEIVNEARAWKDTPWVHQGALKGIGCDCVGMVRGVYYELTGKPVSVTIDYTRTSHLFRPEERLKNELKKYCAEIPVGEAQPGDILLFAFLNRPAHHVGILAENTFIHAWEDVGKVRETPYDMVWKRLTKAAFRFPGVE